MGFINLCPSVNQEQRWLLRMVTSSDQPLVTMLVMCHAVLLLIVGATREIFVNCPLKHIVHPGHSHLMLANREGAVWEIIFIVLFCVLYIQGCVTMHNATAGCHCMDGSKVCSRCIAACHVKVGITAGSVLPSADNYYTTSGDILQPM